MNGESWKRTKEGYVLAGSLYAAAGKAGVHTRHVGPDRSCPAEDLSGPFFRNFPESVPAGFIYGDGHFPGPGHGLPVWCKISFWCAAVSVIMTIPGFVTYEYKLSFFLYFPGPAGPGKDNDPG